MAISLSLVTVGVAVFNGGEDLEVALRSLAAQDYSNLEIIFCDDGSTDGSLERVEAFAAQHEGCRVVKNPTRLGIIGNYNQLIRLARGKYFLYADQDDTREPTFVSRCVEVLDRDPEAVLCHSHTGVVWPGIEGDLYHVNTLDSVDEVRPVVTRYWRFLRHYSDTAIYGLLRVEALRSTSGWQQGLGSTTRLLFELLLEGSFRQVPETLYSYTGKGLGNRPKASEEFARGSGGRKMPPYYVPFVAVAWSQTQAILASHHKVIERFQLILALWAHVMIVNSTKAIYRLLWRLFGKRVPKNITRVCAELVYPTSDIHFVVAPENAPEVYSEGWPLLRA